MKIKVSTKSAVYILWQRTRYTKDFILYKIAYGLNQQLPFFAYPFYYTLALLNRKYIEKSFNDDMQIDFNSIVKHLPKNASSALDIGAGISGIGVFLNKHYKNQINLHLLDKSEVSRSIYYGFENETAFYNSLPEAATLLKNNGVPLNRIFLHEVGDDNNSPFTEETYDLITSFISWGYHYPLNTYLDKVKKSLSPNGVLIVDIRIDDKELDTLRNNFTEVSVIYQTSYLRRILAKGSIF